MSRNPSKAKVSVRRGLAEQVVVPRQQTEPANLLGARSTDVRPLPGRRVGMTSARQQVVLDEDDWKELEHHPEYLSTSNLPDESLDLPYLESYIMDAIDNDEFLDMSMNVDQEPSATETSVPMKPKRSRAKPSEEWLPFRSAQLDEFVRHEGRAHLGDACHHCKASPAHYQCMECFGPVISCAECIVSTHLSLPYHRIKLWDGGYWRDVSLHHLGLEFQLGHNGGPCSNSTTYERPLIVLHSNGFHQVRVSFCGCFGVPGNQYNGHQLVRSRLFPASIAQPHTAFTFEVLELFHHLTLQGKATAWDFYNGLVHSTDNTGVATPPKRYDEFVRVVRQWRHLKMLKRAGRGHCPDGVDSTPEGGLAVQCPACPQEEKNLPKDWETPQPNSWIYRKFFAMDANFRLKLKDRGIKSDPELGPGWAYFVEEKKYQKVISAYGDQVEPNQCDSGLHAIDHANTRFSKDCIANGVGNIVCARHTFVETNSAVDLQRGEKYCNMDYAFLSVIRHTRRGSIVLSYDIACQYHKHFFERVRDFPSHLQFPHDHFDFSWVIPKFHIYGHGPSCQCRWSLNYRRWVGRTDGEGVEREWSHINPVAMSTRMMGPGTRHDTLDDHWGAWNWRKVTGLGQHLLNKLVEAIPMRRMQDVMFKALNATFPEEQIREWEDMVLRWQEDPDSAENPFEETVIAASTEDVAKEIEEEDKSLERDSGVAIHETTAAVFLITGFELEDRQRILASRIQVQKAGEGTSHKSGTTSLAKSIAEQRRNLERAIETWRSIQPLYQPGITQLRQTTPNRTNALIEDDEQPERTQLYLPSSMPVRLRQSGCIPGLLDKEKRLRVAEAEDTLVALRRQLRITNGVFNYKKIHVSGTGQRANTRARALLSRVIAKTQLLVSRYRIARNIVVKLDPNGDWTERLKVLNSTDVRGPGRMDEDTSEGRRDISWLWFTPARKSTAASMDVDSADEFEVAEGLRVEWAKAQARAQRWDEEVTLLVEEMRRTIVYLDWRASWWRAQKSGRPGIRSDITEGMAAYAERQAHIMEDLALHFGAMWYPLLTAAQIKITWPQKYFTYAETQVPNLSKLRKGAYRRLLEALIAKTELMDLVNWKEKQRKKEKSGVDDTDENESEHDSEEGEGHDDLDEDLDENASPYR